jgi:hypothetical protein
MFGASCGMTPPVAPAARPTATETSESQGSGPNLEAGRTARRRSLGEPKRPGPGAARAREAMTEAARTRRRVSRPPLASGDPDFIERRDRQIDEREEGATSAVILAAISVVF